MRSPAGRQRGVALLIVLLVVAAAVVLATSMLLEGRRNLRASGAWLDAAQALYYARGGEAWAGEVLWRDRQADLADNVWRDGRTEVWAAPLAGFAIDRGKLYGRIVDLQGRFNINNVRASDGTIDPTAAAVLARLLAQADIDPDCDDRILDWLDRDREPRPRGAEDEQLLSADPPHLAANRPLVDIAELGSICQLDIQQFRRLRKLLTALPVRTAVNFNTAAPPVLEALAPQLGRAAAERISRDQVATDYADLDRALANTGTSVALAGVRDQLTTGSSWFEADIAAHYGGRVARLRSVLYRDRATGQVTVERRTKDADLAVDSK